MSVYFALAALAAGAGDAGPASVATAAGHLLDAMKSAADGSALMITWALATIGGSVAAILSTSYVRPGELRMRLIYLLYIPAWLFLGFSIRSGNLLARRYIAAHFVSPTRLQDIATLMNHDYGHQQDFLAAGLALLAAWLVLFLLWWIFAERRTNSGDS